MSNQSQDTRIVGQAPCPRCLLYAPAEESRAHLGADGRISCVMCGQISHPVPPAANQIFKQPTVVLDTAAAIISGRKVEDVTFPLRSFTCGSGYGAYHLGGDIDSIQKQFVFMPGAAQDAALSDQLVTITYFDAVIKYAEQPATNFGQDYDRKSAGCAVPYDIDQIAQRLAALGYRFMGTHELGNKRYLRLIKGSLIPGTSTLFGITAELSWQAD